MGSASPTGEKPRLSDVQKKTNHIKSEQKRREAIRDGFDRLASMVPGMEGLGRSEYNVLDATVRYLREQITYREQLIARAKAQGIDTAGWDLPKDIVDACQSQLENIRMNEAIAQAEGLSETSPPKK